MNKQDIIETTGKINQILNTEFAKSTSGLVSIKDEKHGFYFICGGVEGVIRDSFGIGIEYSNVIRNCIRKWRKVN